MDRHSIIPVLRFKERNEMYQIWSAREKAIDNLLEKCPSRLFSETEKEEANTTKEKGFRDIMRHIMSAEEMTLEINAEVHASILRAETILSNRDPPSLETLKTEIMQIYVRTARGMMKYLKKLLEKEKDDTRIRVFNESIAKGSKWIGSSSSCLRRV